MKRPQLQKLTRTFKWQSVTLTYYGKMSQWCGNRNVKVKDVAITCISIYYFVTKAIIQTTRV